MTRIESTITGSGPMLQSELTPAETAGQVVLATEINSREKLAARWQEVIDNKLIEWGNWRNDAKLQECFEAEGFVGPESDSIRKAYRLVAFMRERDWPLPTGVIPDGEGGIVFENKHDMLYQRIEIDDQGEMLLVTFENAKLLDRCRIDIE